MRKFSATLMVLMLMVVQTAMLAAPALALSPAILQINQEFIVEPGRTANETVNYVLQAATPDAILAGFTGDKLHFSITGTTSHILNLQFRDAGVYEYTLFDAQAPAAGYEYAGTTYRIEVLVGRSGTTNVIVTTLDGKKLDDESAASFRHTYGEITHLIVEDPPVKKRITGDRPPTQQPFQFAMIARDPSFPMPVGDIPAINGRIDVTIMGEGEYEFGWITYTEPGVFIYDIIEINTRTPGYTYDTTVYTITDTVIRLENGMLENTRTITNDKRNDVSEFVFTNVYSAKDSGSNGGDGGNGNNGGDGTTGTGTTPPTTGGLGRFAPKTGDVIAFTALVALAAAVALIVIARKRKEQEEQEQEQSCQAK